MAAFSRSLPKNYTPIGAPGFDATKEWHRLEDVVRETEARAESPEITKELRSQALNKRHAAKNLHGVALENQIRKNRVRWLREAMTNAGTARANELGWPNTYTLHEESRRIADPRLPRCHARCRHRGRAAFDRRVVHRKAVPRLE